MVCQRKKDKRRKKSSAWQNSKPWPHDKKASGLPLRYYQGCLRPLQKKLILLYSRIIGADCQPNKGNWHKESTYLRFIQGFFQSAPQLIIQAVIMTKGILIHSLRELVDNVQVFLASPVQDQTLANILDITISGKTLRWFWGLIQLYSIVASFLSLMQVNNSFFLNLPFTTFSSNFL